MRGRTKTMKLFGRARCFLKTRKVDGRLQSTLKSIELSRWAASVPVQPQTNRLPRFVITGPSMHVSLEVCLLPQAVPLGLASTLRNRLPTPCHVRKALPPLACKPGLETVVSPSVTLFVKFVPLELCITFNWLLPTPRHPRSKRFPRVASAGPEVVVSPSVTLPPQFTPLALLITFSWLLPTPRHAIKS